jgi:hypothetical protein
VVSEETGSISLVVRGRIERNLTEEQLRRRIFNLIRPAPPRRAVPLLRRTLEGRWQLGRESSPALATEDRDVLREEAPDEPLDQPRTEDELADRVVRAPTRGDGAPVSAGREPRG